MTINSVFKSGEMRRGSVENTICYLQLLLYVMKRDFKTTVLPYFMHTFRRFLHMVLSTGDFEEIFFST